MPGDVLGSGTVGNGCLLELTTLHGVDDYSWLVPGDDVRIVVDGLGVLDAHIVPGPSVVPLARTAPAPRPARGPVS